LEERANLAETQLRKLHRTQYKQPSNFKTAFLRKKQTTENVPFHSELPATALARRCEAESIACLFNPA